MNLPGLVCLTTKTKLRVISALVRQRLVLSFCLPLFSLLNPVPPLCFLLPLHCFSLSVSLCFCIIFSLFCFFICILCLNSETKPKLGLALCFLPFVPSAPGFFSSLCFLFPAVRGLFFSSSGFPVRVISGVFCLPPSNQPPFFRCSSVYIEPDWLVTGGMLRVDHH